MVQGDHAIDVLPNHFVEDDTFEAGYPLLRVERHRAQQLAASTVTSLSEQGSPDLRNPRTIVVGLARRVGELRVQATEQSGGERIAGTREGFVNHETDEMQSPAPLWVLGCDPTLCQHCVPKPLR